MPRVQVSYKIKRKFRGNQHKQIESSSTEEKQTHTPRPKCSSPKKLSSSSKKLSFEKFDKYETSGKGCNIFDVAILSDSIKQFVKCKFCNGSDCVELEISYKNRQGLAVNVSLKCNLCQQFHTFFNSTKTKSGRFDINLKMVYGLRAIGKGLSAGRVLCAMLDLPAPPHNFHSYNKVLCKAVEECAQDSMKKATQEAVANNRSEETPQTDLAVCLDGSWQKRGHKSLNGFVSVTSFDTGKILDVSVMSKYCQVCSVAQYKNNIPKHTCTQNYSGASGAMETAGALEVFRNSTNLGVRYVKYLGDGDSNGFKKVCDDKPYGDEVKVIKLECVNHVKKRMGTRLRELKKTFRKKKLADGKGIGGKDRLTNIQIDKLQEYYGLAIRRGGSDLEQMKRNVWATYFHKVSYDDNPNHGLCPQGPDSWCGYNRAQALNTSYSHKSHNLPYDIMLEIKNIYQDLANPELLKKCLDQRTQNPNESFNNSVWSKIPKNVFVRLNTLRLGVFDAVLSFNNGFSSKLDVYTKLGVQLSTKSVEALRGFDVTRINKAEIAAKEMTREARIAKRKRKLVLEEKEEQNDPAYGPGMF